METLDDLFRRLEQLNDIGASLSNERDINRLLEKILLAAKRSKQIQNGARPRVHLPNAKPTDVSQPASLSVRSPCTIRPARFSISAWPVW